MAQFMAQHTAQHIGWVGRGSAAFAPEPTPMADGAINEATRGAYYGHAATSGATMYGATQGAT